LELCFFAFIPLLHPVLLLHDSCLDPCNLISSGEVQSIFFLCISPLSCLLILKYKHRRSTFTQNTHSTAGALVKYIMVTPTLNPLMYSIRNKDIRSALRRLFQIEIIQMHLLMTLKK
jgi:hypothetical protein